MVRSDPNSDQNNKKASEGILKSYGSIRKNKSPLKAYQSCTEALIIQKGRSFGVL